MGSCMSKSKANHLRKNTEDNVNRAHLSKYDNGYDGNGVEEIKQMDTDLEPEFFKRTSRLIPYSDDDPIEEKIKKIYLRWRMNKKNIMEYMEMLKFDSILQISITNHLPPDHDIEYDEIDDLIDTLYQNEMNKSIFCQYWKMEKYISSKQVIKRYITLMFNFKKWKIEEQLSYVNESDLQLFEQYNPILNTKTLIKENMNQGDILVVLRPRWHQIGKNINNNKHNGDGSPFEESIIKVHSFTPLTFTNTKSNNTHNNISNDNINKRNSNNNNNNNNNIIQSTRKKSPFKLKLFQIKSASDEPSDYMSGKEPSTSPYAYGHGYGHNNTLYSDEDLSTTQHELIPIKLTDFQKYITMQALCTAVTLSERELLTLKSHSKLASSTINNIDQNKCGGFGGLLDVDKGYRPSKKLTDLNEDESTETSVIHHDEKTKYNRFYFTLCMDRTSALLKVQDLMSRINKIIDDLSFLYSIVVQASNANQSASQYIEAIKSQNNHHLLSLATMREASYINICGGLAKYWSDIDDRRSIMKRVQSALQFSALGSVFMYPKDYAARTKWKIGDPVLIFKQDIEKWCPGKITKCIPGKDNDDIEVKYAVLHTGNTPNATAVDIPPLIQGNEEEDSEDGQDINNNNNNIKININDTAYDPAINNNNNNNNKRVPKVTFMSDLSTRGSMSYTPRGPDGEQETPRGHTPKGGAMFFNNSNNSKHCKESSRSSRIDVMDAAKLAKIDFVNDTTLETTIVNRYDRDYVRPMIIKNQKRGSLSVTIDNKVNRTSERLDRITGLGNAVRLNDRLQDICDDDILAGISNHNDIEIIEIFAKNIENKENETVKKEHKVLKAKNIHPIALMLVEVDQLSSKINLNNRPQSDMKRKNEYQEEKYDEEFIMTKVSKILDSVGKHFNQYLTANSQNGSDLASLLESEHTRTDSYLTTRISVNEHGKKGNSIKSEAFRYAHNIFALLLHNTDVAKSLLISRFIQKEIVDLCAATTEFHYDEHYLTVSMAIANLHYNDNYTAVIDSYRSWYKRCSDALKTIRYEGGNGITHADILFGVKSSPIPNDNVINGGIDNGALGIPQQIGFGIVHSTGSNASEPGMALQFQNSLNEEQFAALGAFNNNLMDDYDITAQPPHITLPPQSIGSPTINTTINTTINGTPSPRDTIISPKQQLQLQQQQENVSPTSPISQSEEKNKTITWITGRLDRKYTFV